MKILQNSEIPIYKQIAMQLKEEILSGKLTAGDYLPSIRGLAKDLKISVITTMKAYDELCAEGLVTSVQGKGFVVNPQDTAMIREQRLREVEDHLMEALEAAKTIGMTVEEVKDLIIVLDNAE